MIRMIGVTFLFTIREESVCRIHSFAPFSWTSERASFGFTGSSIRIAWPCIPVTEPPVDVVKRSPIRVVLMYPIASLANLTVGYRARYLSLVTTW
jgi:hypothetical protein